MSEQIETKANEVVEMKKDITDEVIQKLIEDEEVEEELQGELEAVELEEVEGIEKHNRLMSEDEFIERVEEFEERNHGLTLMLDRFFKLLSRYAKKHNVEVDLELWEEVAKPSLNVGFWYYQMVEGQNIMLSYPKISLGIGVLATAFIGLGTLVQIKNAKKKEKAKEKVKEKAQKSLEGKKDNKEQEQKQGGNRKKIEELRANSDLLSKVNKNLSSS